MNKEDQEKPSEEASSSVEREHMFDKVVTPSDVGKLNRLVIPKQHAERYFPLDNSSTNENNKGLLLNFEDRTGNSWRFRYSYWNSSQSYVMTKGWSRFVKDKKLDAGDIVSFQRDSCNKDKLFIDWRRRPKIPDYHHHHTYHPQFAGATMFPRFYSFPQPQMPTTYQGLNLYHRFQRDLGIGYYVRSSNPTAVIESVPVMSQRSAQVAAMASRGGGKRLRLFGVDMECGGGGSMDTTEEESTSSGGCVPRGGVSMANAGSILQLRLMSSDDDEALVAMEAASIEEDHHFFTKKGKSSMSLDLDR